MLWLMWRLRVVVVRYRCGFVWRVCGEAGCCCGFGVLMLIFRLLMRIVVGCCCFPLLWMLVVTADIDVSVLLGSSCSSDFFLQSFQSATWQDRLEFKCRKTGQSRAK